LAQHGYEVFFLDRRGSGRNQQERGDAPSFRRLLDDVAEFLQVLRTSQAGGPSPLFLAGISWGGKLVVALQKRHPGLVDGLILLCPGFYARVRPSRRQRVGILWARLVNPRKRFPIPLSDPELFTASPHWQRFLREDPLTLREATSRLLIESVRLDGYLHVVPKHVQVPVLLLLAEQDRIIANAPTRRFVESFATADKEVIEYPGAQHTLEFEPKSELFLEDARRWLERHIASVGEFHIG
jgi:alpha-beta hydrolase superfamily lysophospholipase